MKPWLLLLLAGLLILSTQQTSAKTKRHHYQLVKPGECPMFKISPDYPCDKECVWDSNCDGNMKCCPVGCSRQCFPPGPL
uniref:Waprin-like protein n=1 Tax=Opheodrys aestivus TaxID=186591 RepID=A0A098LYB2_9SAUR